MSVTLTSSFLECTPTPVTTLTQTVTSTFTTTYCVTLPAACPTSEWLATYTLVEICTGESAIWTPPAVPPIFATTTVVCDVCAQETQIITAPNAAVTTGTITVIGGNGVTITAPGAPALPQPTGGAPGGQAPGGQAPGGQAPGGQGPGGEGTSPYPPVVTAGAPPSLKKGIALLAGVALAAGQFLVL